MILKQCNNFFLLAIFKNLNAIIQIFTHNFHNFKQMCAIYKTYVDINFKGAD